MRDDEIDRALAGEPEILPSSGFSRSVMDAVRADAEAPPPIPFPWKRLRPAIVACAIAFGLLAWAAGRAPEGLAEPSGAWSQAFERVLGFAVDAELHWLAMALVVTLAAWTIGARAASRRAR